MATAQDTIQAVWAPRHISFLYRGFTTQYSCEGLRDKIRKMLSKLGARDIDVHRQHCITMSGVDPFPGVRVSMQVLVPASMDHGDKTGPAIAAHWQNVVLMPRGSSPEQQADCELIEQFKVSFLPLFSTRHISFNAHCVPHQSNVGTHLSSEVLIPDVEPTRHL